MTLTFSGLPKAPLSKLTYFAIDGNADVFAPAIEKTHELIIQGITLTEVFKCILRQCSEDVALQAIAHMQQGEVIALDSTLAIDAAQHGIDFKLPLADSIIYATARKFKAVVWTQDAVFKSLEDVKYYPKKASEG